MQARTAPKNAINLISLSLIWLLAGCTQSNIYEIDTSPVKDFNWTGRVRITERNITEYYLFAPSRHRTEISRIELLGDQSRNIVIRPSEFPVDDPHSVGASARMQEVGVPPDVYLVRMRQVQPEFDRAWNSMRAVEDLSKIQKGSPDNAISASEKKKICHDGFEDFNIAADRYVKIRENVMSRKYDQVSGLEFAFVAAFQAHQTEAVYTFGDNLIVRVHIDDGNLLTVKVEDSDGNIVHDYGPEELKIIGVPSSQP